MNIAIEQLGPHPLNRNFEQYGERWEQMVGSVREHGVIQRPMVRRLGAGYQIVCGHRRVAAAEAVGIDFLDCEVRELSDREVLEILLVENMERENPDPVEEGKLLRAAMGEGCDVETLSRRLRRSVEWITTRQRLLDLDEDVIEAVRKPREAAGHLSMGAVEAILLVPEEERARAVQLVLHPEWSTEVLGPHEAAMVIKHSILEPMRKRKAWEKDSPALVKAWRKNLAAFLNAAQRKDLLVTAMRFEEVEKCGLATSAGDLVPAERVSDGEVVPSVDGVRWVHLAVFHGLPVWVLPSEDVAGVAVVDERLLVMAEEARAEGGLPVTLLTGKAAKPKAVAEREKRIDAAVAEMDGGGRPDFEDDEKPETVISQSMESRAWVDLGPVRELKAMVKALNWPDDDLPEDAPEWLRTMWEGDWDSSTVVELCEWVEGLKKS